MYDWCLSQGAIDGHAGKYFSCPCKFVCPRSRYSSFLKLSRCARFFPSRLVHLRQSERKLEQRERCFKEEPANDTSKRTLSRSSEGKSGSAFNCASLMSDLSRKSSLRWLNVSRWEIIVPIRCASALSSVTVSIWRSRPSIMFGVILFSTSG